MALPAGPGNTMNIDDFGSLPVTPQGNTNTLYFTGSFNRRVGMFEAISAEFAAEGATPICPQ